MSPKPRSVSLLIPRSISQLFGKRPLVAGEDTQQYDDLRTGIVTALAPRDFVERLLVQDIVDHSWQIRRLRSVETEIINIGREEALAKCLETILAAETPNYELVKKAKLLAQKYFSDGEETKKDVNERLAKRDMDNDTLTAEVFRKHLSTFEILSKLAGVAEFCRAKAMKDFEWYRTRQGHSQKMLERSGKQHTASDDRSKENSVEHSERRPKNRGSV